MYPRLRLLLPLGVAAACSGAPQHAPEPGAIRDVDAEPRRTLRAGEGYRGRFLGMQFEAAPRDRRDVVAWDAGFATAPRAEDAELLPFASLYVWQHPDDRTLVRGVVAGVVNDVFFATSPAGFGKAELVLTLDTFTWPGATAELVDGEADERQELVWGHVRPGVGFGHRRQVGPAQDNMFAVDVIGEIGALYFGRGDRTAADLALPDSTLELRGRAQVRLDLLERNLLELPHDGVACGADLTVGHRVDWDDWGSPSTGVVDAARTRTYSIATAYAFGIAGLPFVDSEQHRLVGTLHAGVGDGVDRFSAPRVGGGPDPRGEEYGLIARPILPGAALGEFAPEHYVIGYAGYRAQPLWFAFVDAGVTVGWLDRDRAQPDGTVRRRDDVMTAVGARLSSGFFGRTRFQLLYAYGFDVIRDGDEGGHELTAHVTGYF